MKTVHKIDRETIVTTIKAGTPLTLVEALPRKYYDEGHLPGAIHIPHDEIRQHAATRLPDLAAPIVVYCASATCQNSRIAAETLIQLGYTNVAAYEGGKRDWQDAGLPLEVSAEVA